MWARTKNTSASQRLKDERNKQREALLTIINAVSQAIFTVNEEGHIRLYNAAFLGLIDTNKSLSGAAVDDILPLCDLEKKPISLHQLMKKSPNFERDDLLMCFADGDSIRLNVSVNRIQGAYSAEARDNGRGYICVVRDITKEKSLDDERDEFISVVSHELRTPVAIAEGTISNLQFFLESGVDARKLTNTIKDAHEQIVLLSNMINDLGTLSRAERGVGDDQEEIHVQELVTALYKKYEKVAAEKGLALELDAGARLGKLTTSHLYLEELLQNLITNAIKYTPSGSVTLRVQRTKEGVLFAVKDTGIGIGKADLKHIFDKFYRSEDYRTRETSGTGLGLYVVSKLMKKLNTQVSVESRLNHGSTFSFTLLDTPMKAKS